MVTINAAFYGFWLWPGVVFALASIRKEEKAIWLAFCANMILTPVRVLVPNMKGLAQMVRTELNLIAFLAALAIFVSFWDQQVRKEHSLEPGDGSGTPRNP